MAPSRSPQTPKRDLTEIKFDAEALLDRARDAIRKSNHLIERTHRLITESTQLVAREQQRFITNSAEMAQLGVSPAL